MRVAKGLRLSSADTPVFLASTGGHLEQLYRWADRWGMLGRGTWITFKNEQSTSLLEKENVVFVDYVAPRDIRGAIRTAKVVRQVVQKTAADVVVSTGAAVAVSGALATTGRAERLLYIESLARVDKLSLTGKLLKRWPGVDRYTQSPLLESTHFKYDGSILDDFSIEDVPPVPSEKALRVLVTLGTIRPFGFDRVLKALDKELAADVVTWQIGESSYIPTHGRVEKSLDRAELIEETKAADVVISHAGVGSILASLGSGKRPIVVARLSRFQEHIDDHQLDIANLLGGQGLVLHLKVEELTRERVVSATDAVSVHSPRREENGN
ncbi:glycosyltransferase [Herbiconiux liukaitaii]|uniref:glycosyltransferase n=1 Tax=Herbiconiux liukaitaii TaxID=3342799 RepID=UPI0035B8B005